MEVLTHAEKLAIEAGLLTTEDNYEKLFSDEFHCKILANTVLPSAPRGNRGMSIGIMSAKLGFSVSVRYNVCGCSSMEKKDKATRSWC